MPILHISVFEKIATYRKRDGDIVCGNTDYTIEFEFDSEWEAYSTKTARFIWNGSYLDTEFSGDTCAVPKIKDTDILEVGVYAGDLSTTTKAVIGCKRSVLCGAVTPMDDEEADAEYASAAKEYATQASKSASDAAKSASEAKSAANSIVIPTTLPNPQPITINGTSYDGSKAVNLTIQGGGGGMSGEDGATFTPSVSADGVLSWTNDKGLDNPAPVNIKGDPIIVTESYESPDSYGKNMLVFSDGTSLYVRNGKDGIAGVSATHSWNGTVLSITSASGTSSVDLKGEAGKDGLDATPITPIFVNDISECTDTTKPYVLPDGFIYAYLLTKTVIEGQNRFVPSTATLNQRLSGSSGSVSANTGAIGSFVTDYIAVSDIANVTPFNVRLNWELQEFTTTAGENKIVFYDSSKARITNNVFTAAAGNGTSSGGETVLSLKDMFPTATPPSDWSEVAFVRFQLYVKPKGTTLTASDVENLTIKYDHETHEETTYNWTNTGHAFVPADYEDRIIELEDDVQRCNERITILEAQKNDSTSVEVPSFWEDAVDECITKIKALQVGRNCVTFPFFSDNHQRLGYSGILIAKVMKECGIPYCFFGGDAISSGYIETEAEMISQDKAFDDMVSVIPNGKFCRAVGNHDGFWNNNGEKHYYTHDQIYELFLREEGSYQNKVFGGDGTYYYVEDKPSKIRFIVLNTNTVDTSQISWLQNEALSFNDSGWSVVFISHQPISGHYHAGESISLLNIVKNYLTSGDQNRATVIGWFSGHIHRDRIYSGVAVNDTDDNEGEAMGFKQITITSDFTSIAYEDATKHAVANDDLSHAIDFVTINTSTRKVNLTRLGIGSDREYTY